MRELIIGDVHERYDTVIKILDKYPDVDGRVFVGDWFDSFHRDDFQETANLLCSLAEDKKNKFCWGNHDLQYQTRWPIQSIRCSGYSLEKHSYLRHAIPLKVWQRFEFMHILFDNWMISHAGMWVKYTSYGNKHPKVTQEEMYKIVKHAENKLDSFELSNLSWGEKGMVWLRWWDFVPIPFWNQIVGHTPSDYGAVHSNTINGISQNYNIDTCLNEVIILEDGKAEIVSGIPLDKKYRK